MILIYKNKYKKYKKIKYKKYKKFITPIIRFIASNLSPSLLLSNICFKSSCLKKIFPLDK